MNELEKVWLACVMDCEGSMGLYKQSMGVTYAPHIHVDNTVYDFVIRCKTIANIGSVDIRQPRSISKLPVYRWNVYGFKNCLFTLQNVYPYLIIKQDKARQVMRFCQYKLNRRGNYGNAFVERIVAEGDNNQVEDIVKRFRL